MRLQQVHRLVGPHHRLAHVRHELLEVPVCRVDGVRGVGRLDVAEELGLAMHVVEEVHRLLQPPGIAHDLRLLEPDPEAIAVIGSLDRQLPVLLRGRHQLVGFVGGLVEASLGVRVRRGVELGGAAELDRDRERGN